MTTELKAAADFDAETERPKLTGAIPYLTAKAGPEQARFYEKAFGAKIIAEMMAEDGKRYMHACLELNGGHLMMSDAFPEHGYAWEEPKNLSIFLPSDRPQPDFDRAVAAGCEVVMPMAVQFWGDRYGQVKDPYGVLWAIGGPA